MDIPAWRATTPLAAPVGVGQQVIGIVVALVGALVVVLAGQNVFGPCEGRIDAGEDT
ncbi:hypothetical protein [Nocardioides sp. AE5]|uniref:hypothetical protein n=1 Tax=Nocardioides sp. AE5 TaxID=2962573 RepID=UPI0028828421|nr:hypothetical protein [Nocardioides sp. AE5]MDT0203062.1 hypothetical protein [Nocardioides sp. AE5]